MPSFPIPDMPTDQSAPGDFEVEHVSPQDDRPTMLDRMLGPLPEVDHYAPTDITSNPTHLYIQYTHNDLLYDVVPAWMIRCRQDSAYDPRTETETFYTNVKLVLEPNVPVPSTKDTSVLVWNEVNPRVSLTLLIIESFPGASMFVAQTREDPSPLWLTPSVITE